jgi:hypothetical protein
MVLFYPALSANISYSSSDGQSSPKSFLNDAVGQQLWIINHISNTSISSNAFWKKKKLSMTHGFFTTTFMLPEDLICRSLEICANYSWKETFQLIH